MPIRILLADDQALLRTTFRTLIDTHPDMEVVAEAADGEQALAEARTHHPDIVLMDIRMPRVDGLAATNAICGDPDLTATRVLILTTFETDEHVAQALRAGASGFLGKDVSAETLLEGIRTVAAGDALLSPAATRTLIRRFIATPDPLPAAKLDALTTRESEVVTLVAEGKDNTEIAEQLFVSPYTVRTHVQRAMNKLHARDRAQLVVIAYRTGLARP
ncbi:response regulator transcription factor [Streptomyces sp. NL15-2K]|uniref:response regulator transcription factor n=1 Tax=Streptomyces sp. NL15-2K TaxID=376149 RepID=UPI000F561320|nr:MULTISPECIES: response regulator transcription factor [Actinomycetes]WKX06169.1 response regulator transcription factor [Kutzneria buriramensis]GCB52978.1 luxR family DNA-binding response regulator [Streptomyces sp. NL15-2K]